MQLQIQLSVQRAQMHLRMRSESSRWLLQATISACSCNANLMFKMQTDAYEAEIRGLVLAIAGHDIRMQMQRESGSREVRSRHHGIPSNVLLL